MPFTKKFIALLSLMLVAIPGFLHAQYNIKQNRAWIFGRNTGVSFATGSPVVVSSSLFTDEGSASLADTAGNLLFYTQGDSVWNRNNVVMPNGHSLAPFSCNSTTQAAVIVPVMGTTSKYYLFSMEHILASGRLAYSIVDMSLDGGLGDVPAATKGIMIDSGFAEKMLAVRGNCCIWLIVHKVDSAKFFAYKITSSGINLTPVISKVGAYNDYEGYGVIKVSPDRSKIALTHFELGADTSRTELYDFNAATGIVSHYRLLNRYDNPYGAEFSPDNSKLYVHHWTFGKLLQYNVGLSTDAAIVASEFDVAVGINVGSDMRLGPDSNIYFSKYHSYLDRINDPNLAGAACNYVDMAVDLSPGMAILGMPALYWADSACPSTALQPASAPEERIAIYPNPAKGRLNISLPGAGVSDVQVLDMTGRIRAIASGLAGKQVSLDISDLPDGNYVVRVNYEGEIYRRAIVVEGNER